MIYSVIISPRGSIPALIMPAKGQTCPAFGSSSGWVLPWQPMVRASMATHVSRIHGSLYMFAINSGRYQWGGGGRCVLEGCQQRTGKNVPGSGFISFKVMKNRQEGGHYTSELVITAQNGVLGNIHLHVYQIVCVKPPQCSC